MTTLGYGDAQAGPDPNTWYTLRFAGTSSASPIVTWRRGLRSELRPDEDGQPLSRPPRSGDVLIKTGTPQEDDAPRAPVGQHIGPLPNLPKALAEVDAIIG